MQQERLLCIDMQHAGSHMAKVYERTDLIFSCMGRALLPASTIRRVLTYNPTVHVATRYVIAAVILINAAWRTASDAMLVLECTFRPYMLCHTTYLIVALTRMA